MQSAQRILDLHIWFKIWPRLTCFTRIFRWCCTLFCKQFFLFLFNILSIFNFLYFRLFFTRKVIDLGSKKWFNCRFRTSKTNCRSNTWKISQFLIHQKYHIIFNSGPVRWIVNSGPTRSSILTLWLLYLRD